MYDFEFSSTDSRLRLHPGSELCLALSGLLGHARVDHVSGGSPTTIRIQVRTGSEAAIGTGSHDLLRDIWQISGDGDGGRKSLFLAVFDQVKTTVLTQGRRVDVPAGQLFVASSDVPFTVIQEGSCRWHVLRVDAGAIQLPAAIVDQVLYQPYELSRYLRQLIETAVPLTGARGSDGRPTVDVVGFDHYLAGLAEMILRSIHDTDHEFLPGIVRRQRIERFILRNLGDPQLSASSVATEHSISRRRLYQVFGDNGVGVAEFIRQARIDKAKALLTDPAYRAKNIAQIAELVGIRNSAHFSRLFRDATGMPPLEFRKAAAGEHVNSGRQKTTGQQKTTVRNNRSS